MSRSITPKSFFEGEFNLLKAEEKVLKFWNTNHIFEKSLAKNLPKTSRLKPNAFVFYDGPPFATGLPHYGHILASTIKDLIPRYQTMRGRYVRRRWGWDCHGLPIEEIVERKLGISGKKQIEKIGIQTFNETCRSVVLQFADEWGKMVDRIARWTEFKNSYKTMDRDYMESVWWAFKKIYDKGLVYEGRKVLLYCPRCETPISNFEVAMDNSYEDVTEEAVTVKFKLKPGQKIEGQKIPDNAYILAWTTTPWTLPGNVALAVGKDIKYTALRKQEVKKLYIVASELIKKIFVNQDVEVVHDDILGKDLVGLKYEPLFAVPAVKSPKAFRVYAADFVNTEEGTGVVHTAVVYGEDDFALGLREGLPIVPLLDEKGKFNEKAPEFIRGKDFKDSEKFIKKDLESRGLLLDKKMHQHSYPHCWRCGNVLFYNAIPAWSINIQKIRKGILESNKKEINWFPAHLKHGRYEKSVEQAPDWNISRNRYWGNPIPVWKCVKCGTAEAVGSLDELSERAGGAKNQYWVMRHGEAETNIFHLIDSGQGKYHLTPRGRRAVADNLRTLQRAKIDLIVSSKVLRAKETEEIARRVLGVKKVLFDDRLREIRLGRAFSGCHDSKYHKAYPTYEEKFEKRPEGGESLRDLRRRVLGFFEEMERKYKGKHILLVSHEYPIWMMFHAALGWTEAQTIKEKERRGGDFVNVAEVRELPWKVIPRNETGEADLHRPYIDQITLACSACGGETKRITEIFDSWVEAGSMPFAEHHYPFENKKIFKERFPAQFVAEYIAQTRAWFYVMHVVSFALFKKAPFRNVVTTGTILAEDGSKMSKSKNNFPDPWVVIEKYGADALRLYLMGSVVMQADNLNFSMRDLDTVYRKNIVILSNVLNFYKTYALRAAGVSGAKPQTSHTLDQWIITRTEELGSEITRCLDGYGTVRAARTIEKYIDDLSTWYLRRSRRRFSAAAKGFGGQAAAREHREASATLGWALKTTAKLMAPFTPYISEVVYQSVMSRVPEANRKESVHLEDWPVTDKSQIVRGESLLAAMAEVRRLASLGLAKRAEAGIKVRQPLGVMKLQAPKSKLQKELLEILKDEVNVKEIVFDSKLKDAVLLDTTITPELKEEGTLREFVRMVQDLRQEAGYEPKDKIVLMIELPESMRSVFLKHEKTLRMEVNAKEVQYKKSGKFAAEISTKVEDQDVWLAVRRA